MCGWLRVLVVQNLKEACRLPVRVQTLVFSIKPTLFSAERAGAAARNGCGLKCWRWPAGNQQVVLIKSSPADDGDGHGPGTAPAAPVLVNLACGSLFRNFRSQSTNAQKWHQPLPAGGPWAQEVHALPSRRSRSWKIMMLMRLLTLKVAKCGSCIFWSL